MLGIKPGFRSRASSPLPSGCSDLNLIINLKFNKANLIAESRLTIVWDFFLAKEQEGSRTQKDKCLIPDIFSDPAEVPLGDAEVGGKVMKWDFLKVIGTFFHQFAVLEFSGFFLKKKYSPFEFDVLILSYHLEKPQPARTCIFQACDFFFWYHQQFGIGQCLKVFAGGFSGQQRGVSSNESTRKSEAVGDLLFGTGVVKRSKDARFHECHFIANATFRKKELILTELLRNDFLDLLIDFFFR